MSCRVKGDNIIGGYSTIGAAPMLFKMPPPGSSKGVVSNLSRAQLNLAPVTQATATNIAPVIVPPPINNFYPSQASSGGGGGGGADLSTVPTPTVEPITQQIPATPYSPPAQPAEGSSIPWWAIALGGGVLLYAITKK